MQSSAQHPDEYFDRLPEDRKAAMNRLRRVIQKNLPKGFAEVMGYGMPGWVVPHTLYPPGYHCDPKLPLPFLGIASQKNFFAVYHMGIYANSKLGKWFIKEYTKHSDARLDMGKCCIRFKKADQIPFELIGELSSKITPREWIKTYEKSLKKARTR